ncbi:MAG: DUF423 domain-containing protein [Gammaproteobacteria bacterium]|nr:DUF423 domain-containing protein [Gammaproteobacteria bacterium]MDH5735755.1 DUF423 domain-containing protein [Gammaproteobacteria bacterium]
MSKQFIIIGSINCLLAVALGAFGAHGLKAMISPQALQTYTTGVNYHFFHALGLLAIGIILRDFPRVEMAGWLMLAGIILFSGSLYALSLSGIKPLGMITPVGGLCFIIAWGWLAFGVYRS